VAAVTRALEFMRAGPGRAQVTGVEVREEPPEALVGAFEIR